MKPKPSREEIRELLHELWPSLPFGKQPLVQRIEHTEAEVRRLKKIVTKRKAAKP